METRVVAQETGTRTEGFLLLTVTLHRLSPSGGTHRKHASHPRWPGQGLYTQLSPLHAQGPGPTYHSPVYLTPSAVSSPPSPQHACSLTSGLLQGLVPPASSLLAVFTCKSSPPLPNSLGTAASTPAWQLYSARVEPVPTAPCLPPAAQGCTLSLNQPQPWCSELCWAREKPSSPRPLYYKDGNGLSTGLRRKGWAAVSRSKRCAAVWQEYRQ